MTTFVKKDTQCRYYVEAVDRTNGSWYCKLFLSSEEAALDYVKNHSKRKGDLRAVVDVVTVETFLLKENK